MRRWIKHAAPSGNRSQNPEDLQDLVFGVIMKKVRKQLDGVPLTLVMNSDLCSDILCYCSVGPFCTLIRSVISECQTRTGTLVSFLWHKLSVNLSEFTETANFLGHNGGEKLDRYQLEAERHVRTQKATREEQRWQEQQEWDQGPSVTRPQM